MKLIYLHQYFIKPTESGGTRSYDLAKSFLNKGVNVEVVTTTSNEIGFAGSKWREEIVDGILVHYLYLPYDNSFSFAKRAWVFIMFLWYSTFKLLSIKGDLVLATSTPLTIGIPALIKRVMHRTPYIFEVRDVWPEAVIAVGAINNRWVQWLLYRLEYTIYKYAKFIVPLSSDMQRSIVTRYPKFSVKTQVVVENIAEVERFQSLEMPSDYIVKTIGFQPRYSILYAGTFGKVNNIEYVLKFARKVIDVAGDSIVFLLMGNGSEKDTLIQESKDMEIFQRNVFFLPSVSKKELPGIYRNVTMGSSFVAPLKQLWANSANKFFDTLAASKPILINHYGWQSEVIDIEKIGYILNPDLECVDISQFVEYIMNEENIQHAGIRARAVAESNYSLAIAAKKYLDLFYKVFHEDVI